MRYLVSIIALVVGVSLVKTVSGSANITWGEYALNWSIHVFIVLVLCLVVAKAMKAPYGFGEMLCLACAVVLASSLSSIAPIPALITIGLAMFFFSVIVLEVEAFVGLGFAIATVLTSAAVAEWMLVERMGELLGLPI